MQCRAVTLPVTLPKASAEEKCIFKPHKVQLLPVCDRADSTQLPAAPAWLSATSFAGISQSIPLKRKPESETTTTTAVSPAPEPVVSQGQPSRGVAALGFYLKDFCKRTGLLD